MKKASLSVAIALMAIAGLSSCKKDWVCTCSNVPLLNKTNHNIDDASPHDARTACDDVEQNYRNAGASTVTCSLN